MNRRRWTVREIDTLRRLYPHRRTAEIARALGRTTTSVTIGASRLRLRKTAEYLASPAACRLRRGDNVGAAFRFRKGHVPANKGLRRPGWFRGRMRETQFKKGNRPHTWLPVGTIKANTDGYLRLKVSDEPNTPPFIGARSRSWVFLHRLVWERAYGPVPKGHRIWWKDGNHRNCSLENLELLNDTDHMARTTIHRLPEELKNTIRSLGVLRRSVRRLERGEKRHR